MGNSGAQGGHSSRRAMPPLSEAQTRFDEALNVFIASAPSGMFSHVPAPTLKTLNIRSKKILRDQRKAKKKHIVASGIMKVNGEM